MSTAITARQSNTEVPVERVLVGAYTIPTDHPEADGTFEWQAPRCALGRVRHIEYFHDHVRIEQMLFDGAASPRADSCLYPDLFRPGVGLEFKGSDASRFEVC